MMRTGYIVVGQCGVTTATAEWGLLTFLGRASVFRTVARATRAVEQTRRIGRRHRMVEYDGRRDVAYGSALRVVPLELSA